jgi:hypothetical protein
VLAIEDEVRERPAALPSQPEIFPAHGIPPGVIVCGRHGQQERVATYRRPGVSLSLHKGAVSVVWFRPAVQRHFGPPLLTITSANANPLQSLAQDLFA